ncbi:MAG TPA: hypothetical protein VM802_07455 [Chitinophaga sp.]|uniref:hypothetical protein n=1 Tax=Chitinophaga sp. TaxID=1869181 RepID=UPI002B81A73B|nr:hypothetical protein [Chitinophaga sp.]HVI44688.1 hypothetical protein [Chitinophaga sp.]
MKRILQLFVYILPLVSAGQIKMGDNNMVITPQSVLELSSGAKGFLLPRVTTAQMEAMLSGITVKRSVYGLTVFNTDSACIAQYLDTTRTDRYGWRYLCGSRNRQVVSGVRNGLTIQDSVAILGGQLDRKTIDTLNSFNMEWETNGAGSFMVRKRSGDTALLTGNGRVGAGVGSPLQPLHVNGNIRYSQAIMPGATAGSSGQILSSKSGNTAPIWKDSISFSAAVIKVIKDSLATTFRRTPVRDSLRALITRGDGLAFASTVPTGSMVVDLTTNFTSNQALRNVFTNPCKWGSNPPDVSFNSINATLDSITGTITIGQSGLFNVYCFFAIGVVFTANTDKDHTGGVGILSAVIRCPAGANVNSANNWEVVATNAYQYYLTTNNPSGMGNGISLNGVVKANRGDRFRVVSYRIAVSSDNPTITRGVVVVPGGLPFGFFFKLTRLVGA